MKKIAVLLTVFNRKEKTLACLDLLKKQELPINVNLDIYITDGGSSDGTVGEVKLKYPYVDIEIVDDVYWNQGMLCSWKRAVSQGEYDFFLWLNDDTFIYADCVGALLKASESMHNNAIVTGSCVDTKTKRKLTYGGRDATGAVAGTTADDTPVRVQMINGNIVLVPNAVYKKVGMLDNYFTHARGDFDYGLRAKAIGLEMWQVGHPLGECDLHDRIDKWCDPTIPFLKRWKLMHKPNGMPPNEIFHLENRHYGFFIAIMHFFTIYVRCIFPMLWIKLGKAKLSND